MVVCQSDKVAAGCKADIMNSWTSWKLSSYSTIKTEIADMNDAAKVNVNTRKMYSSQIFICVSCVLK